MSSGAKSKDAIITLCYLREGDGAGRGEFEPCERAPREDILPGETEGEEQGGVAAVAGIDTTTEPVAEGAASSPRLVPSGTPG